MKKVYIGTLLLSLVGFSSEVELFQSIESSGEIRLGAIKIKDGSKKSSTLSLGGRVELDMKHSNNIGSKLSIYTTNSLFGKDSEPMFLDSNGNSYSIIGEAYIRVGFA